MPEFLDWHAVDHLVELREVYDGWSVAIMKDDSLVNRWDPDAHPGRHAAAEEWIRAQEVAP